MVKEEDKEGDLKIKYLRGWEQPKAANGFN